MAVAKDRDRIDGEEVKESIYKANADALEGLVWEWEAALDSLCPMGNRFPAPLEARFDCPIENNLPLPGVLIDPITRSSTISSNSSGHPSGRKAPTTTKSGKAYKTPVTVKGREFYRKTTTVTADTLPVS